MSDRMIERVDAAFRERYGVEPTATAAAPGRVNLLGGHVDYNGGVVLPAAIDRVTTAAVRPRDDDRLSVHSLSMDEDVEAAIGRERSGWAAYVVGTATVLSETVDRSVGADIVIGGDMIMGAGLSSSAALELAVAGALNAAHDAGLSPAELAEVAWRAENEEVGMSCGIMDQFASALGRAGHALRIDCRTREVQRIPLDSDRVHVLVFDTTVAHQLTESGFDDRVQECRDATARLESLLDRRVRDLRDVTPEDIATHADDLESPLDRRARHVTTEIERVQTAANALREGDIARVGSLMRTSHRSLRDDYGVSCAELDAVVDILADRAGVYGCRMTGGGWGGSVVALVDPDATDAVADAVERAYRERTGIDGDAYVFETADGLSVMD